MDHNHQRKIVYIRARTKPPLFVRFMGSRYFPVSRILYKDRREHQGYLIAVGDIVEVVVRERAIAMDVGEDSDFTEEPALVDASS